tara:strand:- start:969 stop:1565 length:597 start_codon:yes stop_codon:yes gene_type:complete
MADNTDVLIKVDTPEEATDTDIMIKVDLPKEGEGEPTPHASVELKVRKTLEGNLMITDHEDIDIVLVPAQSKIVALPKEHMSEDVYVTQNRLFDFLVKKGVIMPETIQGGNVYGAMEARIPVNDTVDVNQVGLFIINKFIEEEKPYFMSEKTFEKQQEAHYTDPDEEDSTELGEVSHAAQKGSMPPWAKFGLIWRYYE